MGFPSGAVVKNPPTNAGDISSIPELGRSLGEGDGNPFQYSFLGNPMDRGAWRASLWGSKESDTTWQLKNNDKIIGNTLVRKVKVEVKSLSCAQLFATTWTVAYQAPPSMGFSRQGYWSGVPFG